MTLYFRLFWMLLTYRFKSKSSIFGPVESHFRVWPSDLDMLGHMTNSRYFNIMDAARGDLLLRAGLAPALRKRGWYPVVVGESILFRSSLKPFIAFKVRTEVVGFNEGHVVLKQTFLTGSKVRAVGLVRARFLGPGGQRVAPRELMELGGESAERPIPAPMEDHHRYLIEELSASSSL